MTNQMTECHSLTSASPTLTFTEIDDGVSLQYTSSEEKCQDDKPYAIQINVKCNQDFKG